jgi:hypothetical protein
LFDETPWSNQQRFGQNPGAKILAASPQSYTGNLRSMPDNGKRMRASLSGIATGNLF